jgi:polar amino acid transport system permease protein
VPPPSHRSIAAPRDDPRKPASEYGNRPGHPQQRLLASLSPETRMVAPQAPPSVLPARRPWGWVVTVLGLVMAAWIAYSFWTAPTIDHATIAAYLFNRAILQAALQTVLLTLVAMLLGIFLGVLLDVMRQSGHPGLRFLRGGYIWLFRGTPVLLQIIIWFNISLVFPTLSIGVPFSSIHFGAINSNVIFTPFIAASLGLGLNEAAYMAEIVRSGFLAVSAGEIDAARALGLAPWRVFRRVTLPQALRVIVPPTGNEVIGMLKTTSLTSVIGYGELLLVSERIYGENLRVMELLIVAGIWYLIMTTVLTFLQQPLERRLGRGFTAAGKRGGLRLWIQR